MFPDLAQDFIEVSRAVAREQRSRVFRSGGLAEEKDDLSTAAHL
jgi:hypothetical protein